MPLSFDVPLCDGSGDENNGCDYVIYRPLHPGAYWVHLPECPTAAIAVEIHGDQVLDTSRVSSGYEAWPADLQTVADCDGRVMWFLLPEQYLTEAMRTGAQELFRDVINRVNAKP